MNRGIKKELSDVAPMPDHTRKDTFIRAYRKKNGGMKIGTLEIVKSQLGYIRMPVWLISLAALILAIWGIHEDREVLFAVSAIMPFVSGIAIFEDMRSGMYGMTELESVTLVSKRGMLFARYVCIGVAHIILISVLTVLVGNYTGYSYLMTGAMLTIPYLLSSVGSMELERTVFGRKNAFGCMVISAAVSVLMIILDNARSAILQNYQWVWYLAGLILIVLECIEIKKTLQWEEYAWN